MKTISLKKVTVVAVASLGFGLLSAVPAFAVGTYTPTLTSGTTTLTGTGDATASATGAVGTAVNFNVLLTGSDTPTAADNATTTPVITGTAFTNAATAVRVANLNPVAGTLNNMTSTITAATGVVVHGTTATAAATAVTNYTFTPDVPGTYIITFAVTTTAGVDGGDAVLTYTATMTGAKFMTTGNTPAPVAASVTSGSALVAVAGGFAKFTLAQGQTDSVYNITATGMNISSAVSQIDRTVDTTQKWTPLNGVNVGGGVQWAPVGTNGYMTITVTSLVAGTGTLTVAPIGTTGLPGTPITGTVTWGSPLTPSTQFSLVKLLAGTVATDVDATTVDTTSTTVSSTAGTQRFTIEVETNDQNGSAITMAALSATITGPGLIGVANSRTVTTASGRSLTIPVTGAFGAVSVFADGSAGVSTITVAVTNSAGVTTVLGSKTVTFVGAAAKATVTQNLFIAASGTVLGITPTSTLGGATTVATTPALKAVVTDAAGIKVVGGSASVKVVSSNSAIITAGTCVELLTDGTATADVTPTPGVFECSVSGTAAALSGQSATITFQVLNSTTGLFDILATPITFKIGGAIALTKISLDKTAYAPGSGMIMKATATDSSGNAAFDGQTAYVSVAANMTTTGLPTAADFIVNGTADTETTMFAPGTSGAWSVTGKTAATAASPAGVAFTASATITDANAALMTQIDALNAKIVALNALIAKIMKKLGVK